MHFHAPPTLTYLLTLSTLANASAYKCPPNLSYDDCLAEANAFYARPHPANNIKPEPTPDSTAAPLYPRAAQLTCLPTVNAAECFANGLSFSANLTQAAFPLAKKTAIQPLAATALPPLITPAPLFEREEK